MAGADHIPDSTESVPAELEATESATVSQQRNYSVHSTSDAKSIAQPVVEGWGIAEDISFGLPEVDDRYHIWRVPLCIPGTGQRVGEVVIDAKTGDVQLRRSSSADVVRQRVVEVVQQNARTTADGSAPKKRRDRNPPIELSPLPNTLLLGDSELTLTELPDGSVDLVFTSPPYFNARPDYMDYAAYDDYLLKMRQIIRQCHRLLAEGRFIVMNIAPVLIRRASRNEASRRIAVPFDMHRIFVEEGFDFIDDIIWEKPSGAGWATGRGRRFAADRNPLQYKAVPVTEYVLVYRKHTDKLIDWHIRCHPDRDAVEQSKILGDYDQTNVWRISPRNSKLHPAIFPIELAERVVRYYSFKGDVVLDPFGGIGTTGEAAVNLGRRFVLAENDAEYMDVIRQRTVKWLGSEAADVACFGCEKPPA